MASLRELKEALDQGEDIMPIAQDTFMLFWDEATVIHKTGEVYIYDPGNPEQPPILYTDFETLVEAVEGEYTGLEPLEWEVLGPPTPEEEADLEREREKMDEEWEAFFTPEERVQEESIHPVTYNEVRDMKMRVYRNLIRRAEAKGENSACWSRALLEFCRVNPAREE